PISSGDRNTTVELNYELATMSSRGHALLLACSAALVFLESCEPPPETVRWAGHRLREVRTLRGLPVNIQSALGVGRAGRDGIADRNGRFNPSDIGDGG